MITLLTYIIYLSLLLVTVGLLRIGSKYSASLTQSDYFLSIEKGGSLNFIQVLALFLLTFVVAIRHDVGTDWNTYNELFTSYKRVQGGALDTLGMEPGYYFVNQIVVWIGGGSGLVFGILAFLAWYFIFKSVPYHLLPILVFFLFVDEYFFISLNLVRQFTALGIFVFAVKFIVRRRILEYFLALLIASTFHLSILVLIPLYFLPYDRLYNRNVWLGLYLISLSLANVQSLIELFVMGFVRIADLIPVLGIYTRYILNAKFENFRLEIGLGYLFRVLISIAILYASKFVVKMEPKTKVYYTLFFIGLLVYNLFYMAPLIVRINHYFIIFRSFVLTFTVWYLWKSNSRKWWFWLSGLIIMYLALFLFAISNGSHGSSPYQTIFGDN